MGLDGIELVLAIEEAFRIHIDDEEAGNVSTVGELHRLVASKLSRQPAGLCLTSAAFYRMRRGIVAALGIERHQVKPSTLLDAILPRNDRHDAWRRIQAAMELKLPERHNHEATVGDLARDVLAINHAQLAE